MYSGGRLFLGDDKMKYKLLIVLDRQNSSDGRNLVRDLRSNPSIQEAFGAMYQVERQKEVLERIRDCDNPKNLVVVAGPAFSGKKESRESLNVAFADAGLPSENLVFVLQDNAGILCEHLGLLRRGIDLTDLVIAATA